MPLVPWQKTAAEFCKLGPMLEASNIAFMIQGQDKANNHWSHCNGFYDQDQDQGLIILNFIKDNGENLLEHLTLKEAGIGDQDLTQVCFGGSGRNLGLFNGRHGLILWIAQVTDLNWIKISSNHLLKYQSVSSCFFVSIISRTISNQSQNSRLRFSLQSLQTIDPGRVAAGHLGCSCGRQRAHFHQQRSRSCRTVAVNPEVLVTLKAKNSLACHNIFRVSLPFIILLWGLQRFCKDIDMCALFKLLVFYDFLSNLKNHRGKKKTGILQICYPFNPFHVFAPAIAVCIPISPCRERSLRTTEGSRLAATAYCVRQFRKSFGGSVPTSRVCEVAMKQVHGPFPCLVYHVINALIMSHLWPDRIQVPGWLSADLGWPREWWWLMLCADVPGRHLGSVRCHLVSQPPGRASRSRRFFRLFAQAVLSTFSPHTLRLQRWRTTGVPRSEKLVCEMRHGRVSWAGDSTSFTKENERPMGRPGLANSSPYFFSKLWLYRTMRPLHQTLALATPVTSSTPVGLEETSATVDWGYLWISVDTSKASSPGGILWPAATAPLWNRSRLPERVIMEHHGTSWNYQVAAVGCLSERGLESPWYEVCDCMGHALVKSIKVGRCCKGHLGPFHNITPLVGHGFGMLNCCLSICSVTLSLSQHDQHESWVWTQ